MLKNTTNEAKEDILKRLEKLNQWQEEQKKLLQERQNMQRRMLGLEQKNMYQVLGLLPMGNAVLHTDVDRTLCSDAADDPKENYETRAVIRCLRNSDGKANTSIENDLSDIENARCESNQLDTVRRTESVEKPRKTFLKRGEGLKQRFRIDPEVLRINNLPRYKYTNAHPKLKKKRKCEQVNGGPQKGNVPNDSLDAHERCFQQMLISSNNVYNSTPDMKSSSNTSLTLSSNRVRFAELPQSERPNSNVASTVKLNSSAESISDKVPISWAKVLDPQQIKPISVVDVRTNSGEPNKVEDDNNLSIFELLERQANEGTIDMNSSCIKKFMERKMTQRDIDDSELIPINKPLLDAGIKPAVKDVLNESNRTERDNEESSCTKTLDCCDSTPSTTSPYAAKMHVHFVDESSYAEYDEETTMGTNETTGSRDLFQYIKEALAIATKDGPIVDNCKTDNTNESTSIISNLADRPLNGAILPYTISEDLKEKANLVKDRLEVLEKEIAIFKQNNIELLKMKREHELEKAHFEQQHLEAVDKLKDEKIQIEIYLHDERMKFEEEKRKYEQQMRLQRNSAISKERKEIARLKEEVETLNLQLKQKEQVHAAAQARLRVQIRNLEKDHKQFYDDIERLTKENKKLQNENIKIKRENNNKMLQEINRNIAKLAPKVSPVICNNMHAERCLKDSSTKIAASKNTTAKSTKSITKKSSTITACNRYNKQSDSDEEYVKYEHATSPVTHISDSENFCEDSSDHDLSMELKTYSNNDNKVEQQIVKDDTQEITESSTKQNDSKVKIENSVDTVNEFKREILNSDGSKDIWYPNGNLKKISADGMIIRMLYFNKDIKETNINEGTVKYYYAETNTWHTTYLDGLEILEFPNGQTEHRYKNGIVEVHFPDSSIKVINPDDEDKLEEWRFADGTNIVQMRNGDKILILPNGQKEIHTKLNKRREYPDGTVKLVYPDGSQETRYSNGRVRLKDKDGNLVMDTDHVK